jgi:hypothetical protein
VGLLCAALCRCLLLLSYVCFVYSYSPSVGVLHVALIFCHLPPSLYLYVSVVVVVVVVVFCSPFSFLSHCLPFVLERGQGSAVCCAVIYIIVSRCCKLCRY